MRRRHAILLTVSGLLAIAFRAEASEGTPPFIAAAVNDAGRPAAERKLDAARKPGEMLAFAGIRPGMKVADILPGGGYFTRMFSKAVGVGGHVYAMDPGDLTKMHGDTLAQMAKSPAYANITLLEDPIAKIRSPEALDLVWTSQNYHDLHNSTEELPDIATFNKAVFAMLKPGGVFIVLDHAAAPGAPLGVTDSLHRIDPAAVKAEVTAAGFTFEGESSALRNPADAHTLAVFDPQIRGKTDQFILKFRKPK